LGEAGLLDRQWLREVAKDWHSGQPFATEAGAADTVPMAMNQ
jgi:hypothetical protein